VAHFFLVEFSVAYWLMKSEPDVFSIDDLKARRVAEWDGVRNYQVRNLMRDDMAVVDLAFFYHSSCEVPGIVGIMKITKTGLVDPTALDPTHAQFDPKSDPQNPRWMMVEVRYQQHLRPMIPLERLKREQRALGDLWVLRPGNRLSIVPVSSAQWHKILSFTP